MITIAQCRAARGLLDWTQQDLAEASGLSKTAINNFEKGHSDIKAESLKSVRMAFEAGGLEFLDSGVRISTERAQILKGEGAFDKLLYDIADSITGARREVFMTWPDDNIRGGISSTRLAEHIARFKSLGAIMRAIVGGDAVNQLTQLGFECRVLAKPEMQTMMIVYDTKVAVELWNGAAIIMTRSEEAYRAEMQRFEKRWSSAQPTNVMPAKTKAV